MQLRTLEKKQGWLFLLLLLVSSFYFLFRQSAEVARVRAHSRMAATSSARVTLSG
jgi:hypothetical protein